MSAWFRAQHVDGRDHLLLSVLDWEQGVVQLAREPHRQVDERQRAARNQLLADLFYQALEGAADESILFSQAVPTGYAQLPDKGGYPPDHWIVVVTTDERLDFDGLFIKYRDGRRSFLDNLLDDPFGEDEPTPARRISKEQGTQVYRFRAAFSHQPKLWRIIEIQGQQTLAHLDRALRHAFQHDGSDHLSGFWKLIPRGAGKQKPGTRPGRAREVALGDISPAGDGTATGVKLAELELAVGARVKYVYDFGDWIEHTLTLEAIGAPEKGVKYPREAGRNEPKYANCMDCAKKGRQTPAEWICLDCSNEQDKEVLLCEACLSAEHEEHYSEEIVY